MINREFITNVNEYVTLFLNELKFTNKSFNSIKSYKSTFNSFIDFLNYYEKDINFHSFKRIHIIEFLEYKNINLQKQSDLKISSKKLYVTHLRTFFTFVKENSDYPIKIEQIFNFKINIPKLEPKEVNKEQLDLINDYLNNLSCDSFDEVRKSMIIKLLINTGARRAEIINLRTESFVDDDEIYVVKTIGKGNKSRVLYIKKALIEKELNFYNSNNIEYIASSKTGKKMDGSQVYKLVKNIFKKLNLDIKGVHIFRHTFAKNLVRKNVNIINIKEILGHSNIQTTMVYTNPNETEVKNAYIKAIS